jgi:hypothetical protein
VTERDFAAVGGPALAGCDLGADRPTADATLDGFIELSRVVTGVNELPRKVAFDYLNALEQAALPIAPSTLVRIAGYGDVASPRQERPLVYGPTGFVETAAIWSTSGTTRIRTERLGPTG